MGKRGRPPGRKTWRKTRGVEIAEAFYASRLSGLPTGVSSDDVGQFFHVEPESVLRSFYRHKAKAILNVDGDALTQLALLMSMLVDEILDEMQPRLVSAFESITDPFLIEFAMRNVVSQMPCELQRRTRNLSSNPEAQELIDAWVNDFCEGFSDESEIPSPG